MNAHNLLKAISFAFLVWFIVRVHLIDYQTFVDQNPKHSRLVAKAIVIGCAVFYLIALYVSCLT